jgi:CRP-like cAMP-binding protein
MVSLLSMTQTGDSVEVATVGSEGMIGLPIVVSSAPAPYSVAVQLRTDVPRLSAETLRLELTRGSVLHHILLRYLHSLVGHMAQTAVCYRFHTARQRLCRWLLAAADRADSDTLELTQQLLAQTLGLPRTRVTAIAVELQDEGAIRCRHGHITILNRPGLMAASCECYGILRGDVHAPLVLSH